MNTFLKVLVLFSSVGVSWAYKFSCQIPTRWIRMRHVVDVSTSMKTYNDVLENGVLKEFYDYIGSVFTDGNAQGLISFSNKKIATSFNDTCAATQAPLSFDDVSVAFAAMERDVALGGDTRTVMDAMYLAASENWDTPLAKGRTFQFVYTDKNPSLPPNAFDPFVPGCDCEDCHSPSPMEVAQIFDEVHQYVIFVVDPQVADAYELLLTSMEINGLVVPLVRDPAVMLSVLQQALDSAYCGVDPPTQPPDTDTTPVVITLPTQPCSDDAVLQLVHLQDMSWSYTNDLANMRAKFPELLQLLEQKFFERRVALGSFVDKPLGESGYPSDYCYRQESDDFTTDAALFTQAFDALKHRSGRDWKESQYDAVWDAIHADTLSWIPGPELNGRKVLKVVLLATDAGPHIRGDMELLPPIKDGPCNTRDYPLPAELGEALDGKDIYPIFVVTSDIYNYWVRQAADVTPNARVLHLSQPANELFDAIVEALEGICVEVASKK